MKGTQGYTEWEARDGQVTIRVMGREPMKLSPARRAAAIVAVDPRTPVKLLFADGAIDQWHQDRWLSVVDSAGMALDVGGFMGTGEVWGAAGPVVYLLTIINPSFVPLGAPLPSQSAVRSFDPSTVTATVASGERFTLLPAVGWTAFPKGREEGTVRVIGVNGVATTRGDVMPGQPATLPDAEGRRYLMQGRVRPDVSEVETEQ